MNCVSSLLRNHFIGPDKPFKTQLELAEKSGLRPSTLNGVLKAKQVEPATLGQLMRAVTTRQRDALVAAAVRDALPPEFASLVFKNDRVVVRDEAAESLMSPLARKTLKALQEDSVRDPQAQQWLEMIGRWKGLDKE